MTPQTTDTPGVVVFPPLLFAGSFIVGLALQHLFPVHLMLRTPLRIAGGILSILGLAFAVWGEKTMKKAGTNVRPDKPALVIVAGGPFQYTRNPLYTGIIVFYTGLALALNAFWPWPLLIPMLWVLEWGVVRREERYLETKFGEGYLEYKKKVRRWI